MNQKKNKIDENYTKTFNKQKYNNVKAKRTRKKIIDEYMFKIECYMKL